MGMMLCSPPVVVQTTKTAIGVDLQEFLPEPAPCRLVVTTRGRAEPGLVCVHTCRAFVCLPNHRSQPSGFEGHIGFMERFTNPAVSHAANAEELLEGKGF